MAPILKGPIFPSPPIGQTAGPSGQALGRRSPGHAAAAAVSPCVGTQRPGAPGRLAPGAPLRGLGEGGHHHPAGGAGHHRPPDGGLSCEETVTGGPASLPGFTSVARVWFWKGAMDGWWIPVWMREGARRERTTEGGEFRRASVQNPCLQTSARHRRSGGLLCGGRSM